MFEYWFFYFIEVCGGNILLNNNMLNLFFIIVKFIKLYINVYCLNYGIFGLLMMINK